MTRVRERLRRALLPGAVFALVGAAHFVYLGFFPEEDAACACCAAAPGVADRTWWTRYVETRSWWLGLSYAMSLSFAALALRRYREERACGARNLAIGGITFSGVLAVAGCYLLGCCGSPMLVVYLNLFGAAFIPLAKPLVAVLTAAMIGAAWLWMSRRTGCVRGRSPDCCASPLPVGPGPRSGSEAR